MSTTATKSVTLTYRLPNTNEAEYHFKMDEDGITPGNLVPYAQVYWQGRALFSAKLSDVLLGTGLTVATATLPQLRTALVAYYQAGVAAGTITAWEVQGVSAIT